MSDCSIEGEFRADADPDNHETELVVEAVSQHPPQIVFDDRIEDGKRSHRRADRHKNFRAGESTRQRIDGDLGGEGREQHRAGHGRFGIGVLQPIVQQWKRALDAESDENQNRAGRSELDRVESERARVSVMEQYTGKQQNAGTDLDNKITHAGAVGALVARGPDQEHRTYGDAFPKNEQSHQVAGEYRAERAARIDQAGGMLDCVPHVQRIEAAKKRGEHKNIAKQKAELVYAQRDQRQPHATGPDRILRAAA